MNIQTCRLCHKADWESSAPMVRVGLRHSVHLKCKMDRLPSKEARQAWLRSFPKLVVLGAVIDLQEYGDNALAQFCTAAIQKAEGGE